MSNDILIGRNIQLTYKFKAKSIYVSPYGDVTIISEQYGPNAPIPEISAEYLDAICSRFYYGGYNHQNAIADIMLLNSVLRKHDYDNFYQKLQNNLAKKKLTVISYILP